jgi:hypothetical protein
LDGFQYSVFIHVFELFNHSHPFTLSFHPTSPVVPILNYPPVLYHVIHFLCLDPTYAREHVIFVFLGLAYSVYHADFQFHSFSVQTT